MTLLVGSGPGLWDIGIARIRDDPLPGTPGAGHFLIGITSEIEWADDLYLTVLDDYGLWPRHPRITAGVSYMDYDVAYTNQNVYGPVVPIVDSHRVLELTGATVSTTFNASDSYPCIGTPVSYDYAWYVDGDPIPVSTAISATIDFADVGTYVIRLEITANYIVGSVLVASPVSIAVRYVIVHNREHPLNTSFSIDSKPTGDYQEGGWSYSVTMHTDATETDVRDRTLCLLVARDWYGTTNEQSIGPLEGAENVVCVGWIDGESIRRTNDLSLVTFDVQGPAWWLGVQEGFPTGIDDTDVVPTDWLHIEELDPRKGLFSFLHWRTTTTVITDCWITNDDHRLATTYTPAGSLAEQLRAIAQRINAGVVCDRYGRLFCEIDTQFIAPALRIHSLVAPYDFAIVQTMNNRDWRDEITIERHIVSEAGQVDLSGVYYSGDIATSKAIFSLSPGHYPKHHGRKKKIEKIALDDQAEANFMAGSWLAYFNNEFQHVDTPMSSNYRVVDIAPRMFVQQNLTAIETPRGLVWNNKKLIPRTVSFDYNEREGLLLTDITLEAETFASDAVTGDPPITPPPPPPPPPPPVLCDDPDALNFGEIGECIYRTPTDVVVVMNQSQLARSLDFYTSSTPTWVNLKTGGLSGVNVGAFYNIALSRSTGQCWVITYKDELTLGDNGIWYCADIAGLAPTFTLVLSVAGYRALTGAGAYPRSLGCDDAGTAYSSGPIFEAGNHGRWVYGTDVFSLSNQYILPADGLQFEIGSDDTLPVIAGGSGGVPAFGVFGMAGAVSSTLYYEAGPQGAPEAVSRNHFIWNDAGTRKLYSFVDGGAKTEIYSGAAVLPVIADGVDVLTTRLADGFLMHGADDIADPEAVFGVGIAGAGYCIGLAGYGEVIWIAADAGLTANFIYLRDNGGGWTDKTGDFNTAIGAWAGNSVDTVSLPVTCSI